MSQCVQIRHQYQNGQKANKSETHLFHFTVEILSTYKANTVFKIEPKTK